ncbi:MAG TPA: lipoyl(octanoyl) transferase LipB, partial [Acidimicrobiia bacterium]|nr:lipoyl(octanoyl) transferase LipB [Acidimicrobiia bacterium]
MRDVLRVRWLGRVAYADADALQRSLHASDDDYLLLLEHPHVYTLGRRADPRHVLVPPASVGADLVHVDRGGDVTYHGPGQLVGYPILGLPAWRDGEPDVVGYVRRLEQVLVDVLADLGVAATARPGLTGVWVGDDKVGAIGVKVARGRTRHGFALNVDPDLSMFEHIIPCGITDKGVTSLARLLGRAPEMRAVVDIVERRFAAEFSVGPVERADVSWSRATADLATFTREAADADAPSGSVRLLGRLADAGVDLESVDASGRRPEWMRVRADFGDGYRATRRLMRSLQLTTVCEEAGCPNISECWADGTATFMILGERCTRACGFCLVDTRHPLPLDVDEPARVAEAVATMGLSHAVITSVARDDLADGGAEGFVATIAAVRERTPATRVEVLIPDCKGDVASL